MISAQFPQAPDSLLVVVAPFASCATLLCLELSYTTSWLYRSKPRYTTWSLSTASTEGSWTEPLDSRMTHFYVAEARRQGGGESERSAWLDRKRFKMMQNNVVMLGLTISMHFQQFEELKFLYLPRSMPSNPPKTLPECPTVLI